MFWSILRQTVEFEVNNLSQCVTVAEHDQRNLLPKLQFLSKLASISKGCLYVCLRQMEY